MTHGCIRVHPDDIPGLFRAVNVGTRGWVVYQPVLLAQEGSDVYLEVHRDVYGRSAETAGHTARELAAASDLVDQIDWQEADAVIALRHGIARRITKR